MIFVEDDVLYILVEFEIDRVRPRKRAKNGQNGAPALNVVIQPGRSLIIAEKSIFFTNFDFFTIFIITAFRLLIFDFSV